MIKSTKEIPQRFWKEFCELIQDAYRGAVSISLIQTDGATQDIIRDLPFQSVTLEKQNECSDVITIEAGQLDERPQQHQVIDPIRLVLKKNDESGRYKQLDIMAETGMTEITFSPGIDSIVLEELAA